MEENSLIVHGLPAQCSLVKLKSKFRSECGVLIKSIKLDADTSSTVIEFENEKDCKVFREKLPESISFGGEKHILTLGEQEQSMESSTAGEAVAKVQDTVSPRLNFDQIYTWSDIEYLLQCARGIVVQPTDTTTSPRDIWEYFEDKHQSQGGSLESMYPMVDGIFLSFKDNEAVVRVWNFRPHRIKGKSVIVYQKTVPTAYKHTVIIKPSGEKLTEEKLKKILTSCSSKAIPPKGIRAAGNGSFRVVFDKELSDEEDMKMTVEKFQTDYPSHTALFLLKTDCLQILPFPKDATVQELRTLFENKNLTSGGCVTAISHLDKSLLVHFSSYEDADAVAERHRTLPLFGVSMKISQYFPILLSRDGSLDSSIETKKYYDIWLAMRGETTTEQLQKPMTYRPVGEELLRFLCAFPAASSVLNEKLNDVGTGKITPDGIEIALKKYGAENEKLAMGKIQQFLGNYASEKVKVEDATTRKMIEKRMGNTSSQDNVSLRWANDSMKKEVLITGLKTDVDAILSTLKPTMNTDYMKVDEGYMNWLQETKVLQELIDKHPAISGVENENEIRITGGPNEIKVARNAIGEELKMLKCVEFISPEKKFPEFLEAAEKNQKIAVAVARILERSNVKAILFLKSGKSYIIGTAESSKTAMGVLHRALAVNTGLRLSIAEMQSTQPPPWEFAQMLEKDGKIMMMMNGDSLCIVGFCDSVMQAAERLSEYSKENKRLFQMERGAADYAAEYGTEFITFSSMHSVSFEVVECGIILTGQKGKVEKAMEILEKLKNHVVKLSSAITKTSEIQFFQSKDGRDLLKAACSKFKAIVQTRKIQSQQSIQTSQLGNSENGNGSSILIGQIQLSVRKGDLTEDTSDAIVNSVGPRFNLSYGQLSRAIVSKGGHEIQKELSSKEGLVRVTSSGKLKCKRIIHATFTDDVKTMGSRVIEVLKEAEKRRTNSLSLPAIGTGAGKCDSRTAAKMIVKSFQEFVKTSGQYLRKADIVIFDHAQVKDFKDELILAADSGSGQGLTSRLTGHSTERPDKHWRVGSLVVSVKHGDITQESNVAIVNSTGSDFKLKHGQVSKTILQKGGSEIQKKVDAAPGKLIRVTDAGMLKCAKIIHVVSPAEPSWIKECIIGILQKAEAEQCRSLSIPAIGTGNMGYPVSEVAKLMVTAIREFANNNPPTNVLKMVDFVIFHKKDYEKFSHTFFTIALTPESDTGNGSPRGHHLDLEVFSSDKSSADEAMKFVQDEVDASLDLVINDVVIDKITERERDYLTRCEKQFGVKITQARGQLTILGGETGNRCNAKLVVLGMLRDMSNHAAQAPVHISWEYNDAMGEWHNFSTTDSEKLEKYYQDFRAKGKPRHFAIVGTYPQVQTIYFDTMQIGVTGNTKVRRNGENYQPSSSSSSGTNHSYDPQNYGSNRIPRK